MMIKPGAIAVLLFSCALAAGAWSPKPADALYETTINLSPGNTTTEISDQIEDLKLVPGIQELSGRILSHVEELNARILVESVRQIPIENETRPAPKDEAVLIGRILRAVSSMEGIEYYSESRGRYRTLFERSTRIDNPEDRRPLQDSQPRQIPDREEIYVLQEDGTFGENVYRFEYEALGAGMLLIMTNETRLSWGILPAVGSHNLRLIFAAVPTEEGILFYGLAGVNIPAIFGMGNRIGVSFENRVNAMSDWFQAELEESMP